MLERLRASVFATILILVATPALAGRLHPTLEQRLQESPTGEKLRVIVQMKEQARPRDIVPPKMKAPRKAKLRQLVTALKDHARRNQGALKAELEREQSLGHVERMRPFWIFNGFAVTADAATIRKLAARDDVLEVRPDAEIPPPPVPAEASGPTGTTEWNIEKIRAPEVWALNPAYNGSGESSPAVVGSFDTGVDLTHPDLFSRYRGDDSISWFDPYGEHSFPFDFHGHGTHTTGTAVGGNAGGSQIGVAPGAKWIAAKAWNDNGVGRLSDFHRIFEWFLAPGGNPDNAPDVVNNSWAFSIGGCIEEFLPDIQAWRAAEIFPSVAAGNVGPGAGSVTSPGAYAESFTVGATDAFDEVASFSGRGPSPCAGLTKPDISAPGFGILSAIPGGYGTASGTSMATPHITGAVAVLRSIRPEMTVDELGAALMLGAQDIAGPGVDNDSGQGRLDLRVSAQIAIDGLDKPIVKVLSTVAMATELGPTVGMFTISRTGDTDAPLEIMISVSGTATAGLDYVALPSSVTIPAGASSVTVPVVPIDDPAPEYNETVQLAIMPSPAYIPSGARLATVIIVSDELYSDLYVTGLTAPEYAGAEQSIAITETTKNLGQGSSTPSVTQYVLSLNTVVDAGDIDLGVRNVPGLLPGAGSTGTTTVTIPQGTATGTYYLIAKADGAQQVDESVESNNITFRLIRIGADLIISGLTVPGTAGDGQSITVTETTRNLGAGPAAASVTDYVLSPDGILDAGDSTIGTRSVPALSGGETNTASTTLTLPSPMATGIWYLFARSDANQTVVELNEGNNTAFRAIQIGPDLVVNSLSVPAGTGPGQSLAISETTQNQGASAAAASVTRYYLSTNGALDPSDVFLGERSVPSLGADAGSSTTTSVTVPTGITAGTYFVIARADATDLVLESAENNNLASRAIQVGADLLLSALSVPGSAGAGQSIVLTETTKNQGGAQADATVTRYYLSRNSALDGTEEQLGERSVPALLAGGSSSASTTLTIPDGKAPGVWYVIVKADADDTLSETSEVNNTIVRAILLGPDLFVSVLTAPTTAAAGGALTVSDTTRNQGAAPAAASTTRYYLSGNNLRDGDDELLGSRAVPALAAGDSSTGSVTLTIPQGKGTGTWYLLAEADSLGAVEETSESNNLALRTIQIGPDLTVTALSAPAGAAAGQTIMVSETTKNQGSSTAGASVTRYVLSTDTVLDTGDTPLGTRAVTSLSAGASSTGSTAVTIPSTVAAGTWYLIAQSDSSDEVVETNEGNNTSSRIIQIGPDLTVSALSVPYTSGAGQSMTITETTRNQGGQPAAESVTQFYLSSDTTLRGTYFDIGSRTVPALDPGGSSSASTVATIPPETANGIWYLIAKADGPDALVETNETNNSIVRTVQIGPDFVVTYLSAATSVVAGQTLTVTDITRNQGGAPAPATVTQFYLSANGILDASDTPLDSRTLPALGAGASSTGTTVVTIPATTAAGRWYILAKADDGLAVEEASEANNLAVRAVQVNAP